MGKYLYTITYSIILACSLIYIWHKLLNRKINFKDYKLYITLFGITIISIFNYFLVNKFVKIFIITLIFIFFFRYLFKEKINKCIITPIFYQCIIMVSETIFVALIAILFSKDANSIINSYFGNFISNVSISLISVFVARLKITRTLYTKILTFTDRIGSRSLVTFSFLVILIANVLAVFTYYKINFVFILIFNMITTIICYVIVIYSFKTQNNYNKVSDKYNIATKSLKDYEDMMTKYRVANHENKNLLLTVRAMILNKEKDIPKYIDSIIENKYNDDEKLLFEMSVIPSGGLRATIYSEIQKIKDNNIDYSLNIDNNLKTVDLIELDTDTVINICKVVGVFIDNAIEEVKDLKEKNIDVSLFVEKNILNIKVSNNYKNKIEIDKIFDEGYTTKGKGHGYGLALVKKIVDSNKNFENKSEISKDIFSQTLCIKYKKAH